MSLTSYPYSRGFKSGEFHHAVLSISGTVHTLYLDGSAVAVNPSAGNIFANNSSIITTIMGANSLLQNAFRGFIGDFRVYNSAISSTQVSNLYVNRNLVVHYPFDTSVNKQMPNYATLAYDASFVGNAALTSGFIGTNALSITNTGGTASQYILANPSVNLNATTGLTISCWIDINTTGNANKIMRIFDIPISGDGTKGISVDLSGTNMIYSSYIRGGGLLNNISEEGKAAMLKTGSTLSAGAYGLVKLNTLYTGPTIQIKAGSNGTPTDFYAKSTNTYGTLQTLEGQPLITFLGGQTAYVTKWYDQTGNNYDASGSLNGNGYPTYNISTNNIDFTTGHFSVPDNAYPYGNSSYSFLFTILNQTNSPAGTSPKPAQAIYSGGPSFSGKGKLVTGLSNVNENISYSNSWFGYNYSTTSTNILNGINIADTYKQSANGNGRALYLDSSAVTFNLSYILESDSTLTPRESLPTYNLIGARPIGQTGTDVQKYTGSFKYFFWAPIQLSVSDISILNKVTTNSFTL